MNLSDKRDKKTRIYVLKVYLIKNGLLWPTYSGYTALAILWCGFIYEEIMQQVDSPCVWYLHLFGEPCHPTLHPGTETDWQCARGKASPHYVAAVQPIPVPERRFTHMHMDIVCPFLSAEGFAYFFIMVDRSTRWQEVVPIKSISAQKCVDKFIATRLATWRSVHNHFWPGQSIHLCPVEETA